MNNGKVRIYELSKELSLDNKDILEICEQLGIAVKTHSSTITEAQVEQIRAAAQKYTPSHISGKTSANMVEEESGSSSGKSSQQVQEKRKQQILAIQHKNIAANSAAKPQEKSQASVLASPPKFPVKAQSSVTAKQSTHPNRNPTEPTDSIEKMSVPIEPSQAQDLSNLNISSKNQSRQPNQSIKTEEPVVTPSKISTPKLISPPARPKAGSANSEVDRVQPISAKPAKTLDTVTLAPPSKIIARKSEENRDKERTVVESVVKKEAKETKEAREIKELPKLQRPKPPRSPQASKPASLNVAEETDLDEDEAVGEEILGEITDSIKLVKPKLKRPPAHPAKKGKEAIWEDEEEEGEGKGKAKAGTKTKRRKPLIEDDDDFDPDAEISVASVAVSLSTARPPKPESLKASEKVTTTARAKKPTPKSESNQNRTKTERRDRQVVAGPPESIILSDSLTIRELADLLNTAETEIIKSLFFKGIAVNITQTLDMDTARLVAEELGVKVEAAQEKSSATKLGEMIDVTDLEYLHRRPPVVTIMGHVDHGKTTLLDSIRKTKVAQGEAGGITQHIGAYHVDVEHEGKQHQIVFLDTPGHEAFTAMRARGARVTDIAVLVVAADDGVQPQTKEAISHAKAAGVPIVVAINKVDKEDSNPDRIKQELTEQGLIPEEWGGETIMVPVSALKGENLDGLLEMLILVSEIEDLQANPDRSAKGTVIEAHLDRARGPVATLLVQNGTLRVGDTLVAGSVLGKIKAMIDDRGAKVEAATPSFAVEVLGMNDVPAAGEEFEVFANEKEARAIADERADNQRQSRLQQSMAARRVTLSSISERAREGELKELNLILKADVQGSLEAILGSLQQLPQNEVQVRVLFSAPGEVTETDVDLAAASGAVIIGFNTTLASGARAAADREGVDIRQYNIIYNLLDEVQGAMEGLLDPEEVQETLGQAEVRDVFPVGRGTVAGSYIQSGKVVRNSLMRVFRNGQVIHEGVLDSLKRFKEDAKEVNAGYECGIGGGKFNEWKPGDIIESYQMVLKRRTLATK
jgi:translation initiation factor IF-2